MFRPIPAKSAIDTDCKLALQLVATSSPLATVRAAVQHDGVQRDRAARALDQPVGGAAARER